MNRIAPQTVRIETEVRAKIAEKPLWWVFSGLFRDACTPTLRSSLAILSASIECAARSKGTWNHEVRQVAHASSRWNIRCAARTRQTVGGSQMRSIFGMLTGASFEILLAFGTPAWTRSTAPRLASRTLR
jgi:hypothetical protein